MDRQRKGDWAEVLVVRNVYGSEMYESNDTEHSLTCNLHARDYETLEIMPPERAGRILMPAPTFQLPHRSARKVRLHRARPTLQR
jgi:hypothetical protein